MIAKIKSPITIDGEKFNKGDEVFVLSYANLNGKLGYWINKVGSTKDKSKEKIKDCFIELENVTVIKNEISPPEKLKRGAGLVDIRDFE